MANNWNPNAPDLLGLEWPLATAQLEAITPNSSHPDTFAQTLRSTSAETIEAIQLRKTANSGDTRPLFTLVDIYPAAGTAPVPAGGQLVVDYAPNNDLSNAALTGAEVWHKTVGGATTNLWQNVNDPPIYPDALTAANSDIYTEGHSRYRCEVASAGFPAGARVLRVYIAAVIGARPDPTFATRLFAFRLFHTPSGVSYNPAGNHPTTHAFGTYHLLDCGEINPVTLAPWTPADIQSFDAGGWSIQVEAVGGASTRAVIAAMALRVLYVATENRVAAGCWQRPLTSPVGGPANPTTDRVVTLPSGAANWAKPASGDFTFLWRPAELALDLADSGPPTARANDIQWRVVAPVGGDAGEPSPVPGMTGARYPCNNSGGVIVGAGTPTNRAAVIGLLKAGAVVSNDSQTYSVFDHTVGEALLGGPDEFLAQRISPTASESYLGVRVVASPPVSGPGSLTATVHRVSDGVQMGGSLAWTAEEARALTLPVLEGFLSSAAVLVGGTQYEVRFTASSDTEGLWEFPFPEAVFGLNVTFGGTTDYARFEGDIGTPSYTGADLAAVLLVQPDPPADVAAATIGVAGPGDGWCCSVDEIDVIRVSWTATALGVGFARYEIERQEGTTDAMWQPVWVVAVEATDEFADFETRRGEQVRYRVRVIATTGAFSEWAETDWVVARARGVEVIFASNARPELTVAYDHDPEITYDFLDTDGDTLVPIYGADYQAAFQESEDRGVAQQVGIVANFGRAPVDPATGQRIGGVRVWDPLRAITHARPPIPYVCFLDWEGNRVLAHVALNPGRSRQPAHRYSTSVVVTPITATPAVTEL